MAGCSVLDIGSYRADAKGFGFGSKIEWLLAGGAWSPGKYWENTGPGYLLGYAWSAPVDTDGTADVISNFIDAINNGASIVDAWKQANEGILTRNACLIDTTKSPHEYWYWDEPEGEPPIWTKVVKGESGW